jgi:hypothetical protein
MLVFYVQIRPIKSLETFKYFFSFQFVFLFLPKFRGVYTTFESFKFIFKPSISCQSAPKFKRCSVTHFSNKGPFQMCHRTSLRNNQKSIFCIVLINTPKFKQIVFDNDEIVDYLIL